MHLHVLTLHQLGAVTHLIAMSSGVLHQAKALPLNAAQTVEVAVKPQNIRTA